MGGLDLQRRAAFRGTIRRLANLVAAAFVVMLSFVAMVVLLDLWGERKEHQSRDRAA